MKLLQNRFFLLGNLLLVLLAIPITLWFVDRQQDVRSSAAPSTVLSFSPANVSTDQCTNITTDLVLNPGDNIVGIVELVLTYDQTKFDIDFSPNTAVFPGTPLRGPTISNGEASVTLSIGADVTNAIQTQTTIATITIKPISSTTGTATPLTIDTTKTKVLSLAASDEATENVLLSSSPAQITISTATCGGGDSPTATPTPAGGIGGGNPTNTPIPTATPTAGTNQSPICTELTIAPTASGSAPFAISATGKGQDPDGTITKATFDFGDGTTTQDVTDGMNIQSVTALLNHTYQSNGTFSAQVTFTDNSGAISNSCIESITVSGEGATPTPTGIQATDIPTATPTIDDPGDFGVTIAIIGGVLIAIIGGILLLAL